MKRMLISLLLLIISGVIASAVLPGSGIYGMICGVNIKNSFALVLGELIIISLLLFYNMGKCEKFLNGYGKYKLLRHKKRKMMIVSVYKNSSIFTFFLIISRVVIYVVIIKFRGESIIIQSSLLKYILMMFFSFIFISSIQFYIELKLTSTAGVIILMIYFLFSVIIGGVLCEKGIYLPLIFLLPNYYMSFRSDIILKEVITYEWPLYLILIVGIIINAFLSGSTLKKKDIF